MTEVPCGGGAGDDDRTVTVGVTSVVCKVGAEFDCDRSSVE